LSPNITDPFYLNYQNIFLIDDGSKYQFGTKQRISTDYVRNKLNLYNEFVYVGPSTAMGAYALAIGCVENKVQCTLYLVGPEIPPQGRFFTNNTEYRNFVTIHLLKMDMGQAFEIGEKYVQENNNRLLVPFGINDIDYKNMLYNSLYNDPDLKTLWKFPPRRMWLAVGSGTLLSILLLLLPNTHFLAVEVGTSLKMETLHFEAAKIEDYKKRVSVRRAPERFTHSAEQLPPYSSLNNYDAKIWRFVLVEGQSGDTIWNVARNY